MPKTSTILIGAALFAGMVLLGPAMVFAGHGLVSKVLFWPDGASHAFNHHRERGRNS
jgi:hypothetical protein